MIKRRIAIAILAISLVIPPGFAAETRPAREATAIFRALAARHVVASMQGPPARCQYDRHWDNRAVVPAGLARDFFGLTVLADLSRFEPNLKPSDILDPRHEHAEAFCTTKETEAFTNVQIATFEKDRTANEILTRKTSVAFPVFNDAYTKAAVVIGESAAVRRRRADGVIERDLPEASVVVHFLAKEASGWTLVKSEVLGLT